MPNTIYWIITKGREGLRSSSIFQDSDCIFYLEVNPTEYGGTYHTEDQTMWTIWRFPHVLINIPHTMSIFPDNWKEHNYLFLVWHSSCLPFLQNTSIKWAISSTSTVTIMQHTTMIHNTSHFSCQKHMVSRTVTQRCPARPVVEAAEN